MIFFLLACHEIKSNQPRPHWIWASVDVHVHSSLGSNDTDGLGTPESILNAMEIANLDYVWLSDHSNSQGSMACEDVEACPNQGPEVTTGLWPSTVFQASEISPRSTEDNLSQPVGHIGCLPWSVTEFSESTFIDRPFGEITGEMAIEQCHEAGGFSILNHPFGPLAWVAFDWSSTQFDAIEVYNGSAGFDQSDVLAIERWEQGLKAGETWVPIGASDCHRWQTEAPGTLSDPALGWPQTHLAISEGQSPIEALSAGQVILGDPTTQLNYWASNDTEIASPGQTISLPASLHIEFQSEEDDLLLQIISLRTGVLFEDSVETSAKALTYEVLDTDDIYVRVWPKHTPYGKHGVALGNQIQLRL